MTRNDYITKILDLVHPEKTRPRSRKLLREYLQTLPTETIADQLAQLTSKQLTELDERERKEHRQ